MSTGKAIPNSAQTQWVEIAAGKKKKLPRLNPRGEIDRLIDWYERNKPDMPHVMPGGVAMTAIELDRFATKTAEGVWMYKGWRLEQSDALPRKEKRVKIHKAKR
jgi:hypothetical protein